MMKDKRQNSFGEAAALLAKRSGRRGFTMTEVLVVVAITVVMFSIGFVGVIQYSRMLTMLKMNETATEIYLVAQDQMARGVELNNLQAKIDKAREGEDTAYLGDHIDKNDAVLTSDAYSNTGQYYYVKHDEGADSATILEDMLPELSLDEGIRSDGHYGIVYNAETATIVAVWYTEVSTSKVEKLGDWASISHYMDTAEDGDKERQNYYEESNIALGYYGGDTVNARKISLTDISVHVNNGNRLTATVYFPSTLKMELSPNSSAKAVVQLVVKGMQSTATKTLEIGSRTGTRTDTSNTTTTGEFRISDELESSYFQAGTVDTIKGITTTVEGIGVTLDDVTNANGHFAQLFSESDNGEEFHPGEDLEIYATFTYEGTPSQPRESNHVVVNSLFGSVEQADGQPITASGQTAGVIKVSSFRHLENLNSDVSNFSKTIIPKAGTLTVAQTTDLVWKKGDDLAEVSNTTVIPFVNSTNNYNFYNFGKANFDQTTGVIYSYGSDTGTAVIGSDAFYGVKVSDLTSFTYSGNGNFINNVTINSASSDGKAGLFRDVTATSLFAIDNVKMVAPTVEGTTYAGALVGYASTGDSAAAAFRLTDCIVATAEAEGKLGDTISIQGTTAVGGLVGYVRGFRLASSDSVEGTEISGCSVNGDLGEDADGNHYAVTVESTMSSDRASTGGLIGECGLSMGSIKKCYVKGELLTVRSPNVKTNCAGPNRRAAGGFIGTLYSVGGMQISDSYAAVKTVGSQMTAGGFVGVIDNYQGGGNITISTCYSSGRTKDGAYDTDNYNVISTGETASSGGFVGLVALGGQNGADPSVWISACYSTMSVNAADKAASGGFVGSVGDLVDSSSNNATLHVGNSYSTGRVYASDDGTHLTEYNQYKHSFIGNKTSSSSVSVISGTNNYVLKSINTLLTPGDYANETLSDITGSGNEAKPYDDTLPSAYTFKTCQELDTTSSLELNTIHVGDWPYTEDQPEILYIVNANRLSAVVFSPSRQIAVMRISDPNNAANYAELKLQPNDWQVAEGESSGSSYQYYYEWVLDDPAGVAGKYTRSWYTQFTQKHNNNSDNLKYGGEPLQPGLNYVASVILGEHNYDANDVTASMRFNSLFADENTVASVENCGETSADNSTAYIAYARHLQNLNPSISKVDSAVTKAVQIRDLTWATSLNAKTVGETENTTVSVKTGSAYASIAPLYGVWQDAQQMTTTDDAVRIYMAEQEKNKTNRYSSDGCFAPIENANLTSYDGQSHVINSFQAKGSRAGLFGIVSNKLAISNLTVNGALSDASTDNSQYTANSSSYKTAGESSAVFVAENKGALTFDNVSVSGTVTIHGKGDSPDNNAGSGILVGKNYDGGSVTVKNGFSMTGEGSSLTIDKQANSGGLIGCSLSSNTITFSTINLAPKSLSIATSAAKNAKGAGGVVGYVNAGVLDFTGNVALTSPSISISCPSNEDRHAAGGVVGFAQYGGVMHTAEGTTITVDPGTAGSFSVTARLFAGGILGYYFDNGALTENKFVFNAPMYVKGKTIAITTTTNTTSNSSAGGLIGFIDKPASIHDSYVEASDSITIETETTDGIGWGGAGGLIGGSSYNLTINNCQFADEDNPGTLKVVGKQTYAGGIIAHVCGNESSITGSKAYFTINGVTSCGGIVGQVDNIKNTQSPSLVAENTSFMLDNCTAVGTVASTGRAGGLIGNISTPGLVIQNNCVYGGSSVTSTNSNAGGLVGECSMGASISGSQVSKATITSSNSCAGGLVGHAKGGSASISASSVSGSTVTGAVHAGGAVGQSEAGVSIQSGTAVSNATITASSKYAGGLVGYTTGGSASISASSVSGSTVTGSNYTGGFVGLTETSISISGNNTDNSFVSNSKIVSKNSGVGGIVGHITNTSESTINYTFVQGDTNNLILGKNDAGGLVGWTKGALSVENCYNYGMNIVSESGKAGGLAGVINGVTTLKNVYVNDDTGSQIIVASNAAGGLVGLCGNRDNADHLNAENCFSTAYVKSSGSNAGGLFGTLGATGTEANPSVLKNCYVGGHVKQNGTDVFDYGTDTFSVSIDLTEGSVTVENLSSSCFNVYTSSNNAGSGRNAGGLIGTLNMRSGYFYMENVYTTASARGGNSGGVGGFIGWIDGWNNKYLTCKNCYVTGFVATANNDTSALSSFIGNSGDNVSNFLNHTNVYYLTEINSNTVNTNGSVTGAEGKSYADLATLLGGGAADPFNTNLGSKYPFLVVSTLPTYNVATHRGDWPVPASALQGQSDQTQTTTATPLVVTATPTTTDTTASSGSVTSTVSTEGSAADTSTEPTSTEGATVQEEVESTEESSSGEESTESENSSVANNPSGETESEQNDQDVHSAEGDGLSGATDSSGGIESERYDQDAA